MDVVNILKHIISLGELEKGEISVAASLFIVFSTIPSKLHSLKSTAGNMLPADVNANCNLWLGK